MGDLHKIKACLIPITNQIDFDLNLKLDLIEITHQRKKMKKFLTRFGLLALLTSCAVSLSGGYGMEVYDLYGNLIMQKKGIDLNPYDIKTNHNRICHQYPTATIITRDLLSGIELKDGRSPYHCVAY